MERDLPTPNLESNPGLNLGYAAFQLAKALTASEGHDDAATRERARAKVAKWESVVRNFLAGTANYGSRNPIGGVPAWATLEVVTGGFATGRLLADGPLEAHEIELLKQLPEREAGAERRRLNRYYLTDDGLADLRHRLRSGCYDVEVPEEGALLVVAWLVENGFAEEARKLLDEISPWLASLRFYPIPHSEPRRFGRQVRLQDVAQTIADIQKIGPHQGVLAQKEAVDVWAPFYDRLVALFFETVVDGWPCQTYPEGWPQRAMSIRREYADLKQSHSLCRKSEKRGGYFAQLLEFAKRAASQPDALTGREVGRLKLILERYVDKRGLPDSEQCAKVRARQRVDVSAPLFHDLGKVVVARLATRSPREGLDVVGPVQQPIDAEESRRFQIPTGSLVPASIQRKVDRCLNETIEELVRRGIIRSGERLALVLPQMTAGLRAAGVADTSLRRLYAAIYRAFRRRRSLLLLNLEKQVQIEELPWVAAIDHFRAADLSDRELARQSLEEISLLTISSFPYAIIPNKLLQELQALSRSAGCEIPLVDELAADIFMGRFSSKFYEAAWQAADLLEDSLYSNYYAIDYGKIRSLSIPAKLTEKSWLPLPRPSDQFALLCAERAGVAPGSRDPVTNGMVIEQQQILTTQNLAPLFLEFGLAEALRGQLGEMARHCFRWICDRQQMKIDHWQARFVMVKNTAYAWRQMIFFLSLLPKSEVDDFLHWARDHLQCQSPEYASRFEPALQGLVLAASGESIMGQFLPLVGPRCFLGWTTARHWFLSQG